MLAPLPAPPPPVQAPQDRG